MASKPAQKRLTKEFLAMQKSPPPFVWAAPEEKNILHSRPPGLSVRWRRVPRPDCIPFRVSVQTPGIKMYTPSGRFQPDKKICFSMSDFHPGTWNPAWSVATICTGLLSFMLSDEMTTGSVTSTDVEKRDFALRSHEWNRKQKRFRDAFPDYCTEEMKDLPNMGEKDKGPVEDGEASQEAPAGTTQGPVVRASAPPTVKARAMPTSASAPPPVAGQVAIAPASWRETIWDRWRWGIFILLAVLVSRLSNV
ncbi:ubiquitin-conjugating enzyme E2 [Ceratobasidium sp. AG-Ba]|nr:ubiquitin-conjugating enzyme E2 [Ceratobasidium sp. AG-Ba]